MSPIADFAGFIFLLFFLLCHSSSLDCRVGDGHRGEWRSGVLVVCGVWCVGCGLWCVACGLWLWFVVCGLWFVVCGLWFVVCGLWFVAFVMCSFILCPCCVSNPARARQAISGVEPRHVRRGARARTHCSPPLDASVVKYAVDRGPLKDHQD